jgi:hypothetical protein
VEESGTINLSDFEDLFELHVCFYFDCDLYTKTDGGHTQSTSEQVRIDGDSRQDVRVPEWLMTRLSFGFESSGCSDITGGRGNRVTVRPSVARLDAMLFALVYPLYHQIITPYDIDIPSSSSTAAQY